MMVAAYLGGGGSAGSSAFLTPDTYSDFSEWPTTSTVTLSLQSDGQLVATGVNEGELARYNWLLSGSASSCTVEVTVTSGSLSSGTLTAQSLGTTRDFTVTRTSVGSKTCEATYTIKAGGSTIASASIILGASAF